jgi:predicted DNA-binding transcriptional regulator AlpA
MSEQHDDDAKAASAGLVRALRTIAAGQRKASDAQRQIADGFDAVAEAIKNGALRTPSGPAAQVTIARVPPAARMAEPAPTPGFGGTGLMRVREVTRCLGIHRETLRKRVHEGLFPAPVYMVPGGPPLWPKDEIEGLIERLKAQRTAAEAP